MIARMLATGINGLITKTCYLLLATDTCLLSLLPVNTAVPVTTCTTHAVPKNDISTARSTYLQNNRKKTMSHSKITIAYIRYIPRYLSRTRETFTFSWKNKSFLILTKTICYITTCYECLLQPVYSQVINT